MAITIKSFSKFSLKAMSLFLLLFIFAVTIFYINTTIYNFPEEKPFSGTFIHNPYEHLPDSSYRANFHAHSEAWEKITNGHNSEEDIYREYSKRGYDIVGISNYHKISNYAKEFTDLYIPEYEHGYNVLKSHYLSINPDEVSYFDYPLFQLTSHKQKVIEKLKEKNAVVAMAHPKFGGGRTFGDMRNLVHYDFTEVLNHYRISDEYWDQALSAGRLTYVMGNDDTHDIRNEPTFRIWNIIYSNVRNSDSILNHMKAGQNYGINSRNEICDNKLVSCLMTGDETFEVKFAEIANKLEFVGQNGEIKQVVDNVNKASYKFDEDDTYIRVVARNTNSDLYMNPLVRFDGKTVPLNSMFKPEANFILTWLFRLIIIGFMIFLLILMRKIIKR